MKEQFWIPVAITVGALLMHMPVKADMSTTAQPTTTKESSVVRTKTKGMTRDAKANSPVIPSDKGHVYRLDLNFDTGKADIKPGQEASFKTLADDLKNYPYAAIVIEGHTDTVGGLQDNMKLSQQRAEAVRDYLIKNYAVPGDRISAKGFGYSRPLATNDTEAGRAQNRRIMATVIRVDTPQATGQPQRL